MTFNGRTLYTVRRTLLVGAGTILGYLFVLLVPLVPVRVFIPCGGLDISCPALADPGGSTVDFLYSITLRLGGYGAYYTGPLGYVVPANVYAQGIPLTVTAVACIALAMIIHRKQTAVFRRFV